MGSFGDVTAAVADPERTPAVAQHKASQRDLQAFDDEKVIVVACSQGRLAGLGVLL